MKTKLIKRNKALQRVSREHHHSLLLCWKIRSGFSKGIAEESKSLSLIEEELEQHIRFEERILFNKIQRTATEEELKAISKIHYDEKFNDNTDDTFWV